MDLTEKVFQANDVHEAVEDLSEIIQNAIIIENKDFELVTYSSPNEFSFDPIQQKTILTKRCPLFIIERLKKEGIVDRLRTENEPIRIHAMEDIDFYQRTVISLKHHNILQGYLWIYEANELLEDNLAFLTEVAPYLGRMLYEAQNFTENDLQTVIWKLINDEYMNEAEIYRAANIASYKIPEQFTVIVASVKEPTSLSILDKIKDTFIEEEIAYYLGKGTEIVGIVDGKTRTTSKERVSSLDEQLQQLLTEKEKSAVIIGSGNEYNKIGQIRKSYLEALEVIETMVFLNVEQFTYSFEQLGIYRYMKFMYKKNVSEQYRNRNILRIMRKDAENNSELLKTLWYYIKNNCRVGKTAEQLYIHPNTLNYRVKQIIELTSINFESVHERAELYTQLLLLKHVPDYFEYYRKYIF